LSRSAERGILLAIALSLFRHVRHSYRPQTTMLVPDASGRWTATTVTPGQETEPGLIVYGLGADLFYANHNRFTDEVRTLAEHAPTPVRWFVVDAGAITNIDYSAAQALRDLLDDLAYRGVGMVFARVRPSSRSDNLFRSCCISAIAAGCGRVSPSGV